MTGIANFDFTGQTALITGGGAGIGAGIAAAFAAANANVVITGRRLAPLEKMAAAFPGRISFVQGDVGIEADRLRTLQEVKARHGGLDVLVNNAMSFTPSTFPESRHEDIADMYGILLGATTYFIHESLDMLTARKGCVVNISSAVGRCVPWPSMQLSVYAAAKAGVNHLTRHLASELGYLGIRLNSVAPGPTNAESAEKAGLDNEEAQRPIVAETPLGRFGNPEDIAGVVLFLASSAGAWVTGQVIDAAGGWRISP